MRRDIASPLALWLLLVAAAAAQVQWDPPEGIAWRTGTIHSEGTRLAAEIFSLESNSGQRLPCLLMAHGWGGTARSLRRDAAAFARAGFLAVAFDYRGWGNSDPRVVLAAAGTPQATGKFEAEVIAIREVVDPVEQTRDWLNAMHWLQAEPMCDTSRIGIWGSSYSGGHVLYVAAHDKRVKAVFSQVGGMDSRFVVANGNQAARTLGEATRRARGELPYPEPGAVEVGSLRGAPIRDKLMHFAPVELARQASHAALVFVIAENEELFDNRGPCDQGTCGGYRRQEAGDPAGHRPLRHLPRGSPARAAARHRLVQGAPLRTRHRLPSRTAGTMGPCPSRARSSTRARSTLSPTGT